MGASITPELIKAVTAIVLVTAGYLAYYSIAFSGTIKNRLAGSYATDGQKTILFVFQKLTGFSLMGLLPAGLFFSFFTLQPRPYAFAGFSMTVPSYAVLTLVMLILATSALASRKADVYKRIPHMRLSQWGPKQVLISISGWALYLLAYEYIFRGLLLFSTAAAFGIWPAIAINLLLYSVFHIPNGKKETLAAIPFGFVLCVVSLLTGSFWMAFLLHLVLSISTEIFSIYYNPDMRFQFMRKETEHMKRP